MSPLLSFPLFARLNTTPSLPSLLILIACAQNPSPKNGFSITYNPGICPSLSSSIFRVGTFDSAHKDSYAAKIWIRQYGSEEL